VPFPRILAEARFSGERRHGAPVDEARAGVGFREREERLDAAEGHPHFFLEGMRIGLIISGARWSESSATPDARSVEPSAHTTGGGERRALQRVLPNLTPNLFSRGRRRPNCLVQ
jgi:hypothetical protein